MGTDTTINFSDINDRTPPPFPNDFSLPELPPFPEAPKPKEQKPSFWQRLFGKPKPKTSTALTVAESHELMIVQPSPVVESLLKDPGKKMTAVVQRDDYVQQQNNHMELHRRLDRELQERKGHLDAQHDRLKRKEHNLRADQLALDRERKKMSVQEEQFRKIIQLKEQLENKEITLRYKEEQILKLNAELTEQKEALTQKETLLAQKEASLNEAQTKLANATKEMSSTKTQENVQDDAILYLQQEIERTKQVIKDRAIKEQMTQAPASPDDIVRSEIDALIAECKTLLSIGKVEQAKAHYAEIKTHFEKLARPEQALYNQIVSLYQDIKSQL